MVDINRKSESVMIKQMELLNCPFCGGEATIKHITIYSAPAVRVYCEKCNAQTKFIPEGWIIPPEGEQYYLTYEEAEDRVIRLWNARYRK